MLVLTRRVGEAIQIGDDVVLRIKRVAGKRVVLSFEAPKGTSIMREELIDKHKGKSKEE